MPLLDLVKNICVLFAFGCVATPLTPAPQLNSAKPTLLILEKNEGERRVVRGYPGHPDAGETFILKVDPKNGASSHLVLFTAETSGRGGEIETHNHPSSDELLFFQSGTARVDLGDAARVVHAGATVFIPAGTPISVDNIGKEGISLVCVFSAPGFEDFMRAASALEGEKKGPMSKAEDDEIQRMYTHDVIYQQPQIGLPCLVSHLPHFA
jgi:quercetin dioxygenase-like cupin family protein